MYNINIAASILLPNRFRQRLILCRRVTLRKLFCQYVYEYKVVHLNIEISETDLRQGARIYSSIFRSLFQMR